MRLPPRWSQDQQSSATPPSTARRTTRWFPLAICIFLSLRPVTDLAATDHGSTLQDRGRELHLSISSEFTAAEQAHITAWIDFVAASLLQVYGHWPREQWQITIVPASAAGDDPIPWAQVHRGTLDNVELFVSPQATLEELKQDWTGYHELAHLLIPYRGWGDAWFSEGLASYYQNILQARAGVLTEQQAWQNLYDGFMRGRADTDYNGQALAGISDAMRENGAFMRVYWSGAWYFLAADIRLRQQSGGAVTLDVALQKLNACCANEQLSVPQMVSRLDELNRVLLFQPLYEQLVAAKEMPSFEKLFASLGIAIVDGTVNLQQQGPGAALRRQILKPIPL
ncbi:MAG: hypothetical protein R3E50_01865 [Halioglobus sp.]